MLAPGEGRCSPGRPGIADRPGREEGGRDDPNSGARPAGWLTPCGAGPRTAAARPVRLLHRAGRDRRYKWYKVSWIGLAAAAVLDGLNDRSRVNGHWEWILVTLVSGILFLGYAKVGSRGVP